jgi:uncharacterized protein YciI
VNISAILFFSLKKNIRLKTLFIGKFVYIDFLMASITPKLYILQYEYVKNVLEKRAPYRQDHLTHFGKQVQSGNVILGGAVDNPPTGALMIFRTIKSDEIEEFAQQDPYVINGIVTKYTIKPYIAVMGDALLKDDILKL